MQVQQTTNWFFFLPEPRFDISYKLSPKETFFYECQSLFVFIFWSGKKWNRKKKIQYVVCLIFPSMLSVMFLHHKVTDFELTCKLWNRKKNTGIWPHKSSVFCWTNETIGTRKNRLGPLFIIAEYRIRNTSIFTTLWAYSADDKIIVFFSYFPRKQDLTCHANCLQRTQFAWHV